MLRLSSPDRSGWKGGRVKEPFCPSPKVLAILLSAAVLPCVLFASTAWPWGDELDAVVAAPESHRVLLENDAVRVLEVLIRPGEREPAHTHRWPSVMSVLEPARIRYYGAEGELRFETPADRDLTGSPLDADWLEPEGLHAVENIDDRLFRALRVELKAAGP